MGRYILLGVAVYILLGLFTGINYLIWAGKERANNLGAKSIDWTYFDTEDGLFAMGVAVIWPVLWVAIAGCKFVRLIERCIVIPIVNKGIKKNED